MYVKQSRFQISVTMYARIFKSTQRIMMRGFLIDRDIQEEGLYVYNVHNIVKKHTYEDLCLSSRVINRLIIKTYSSLWLNLQSIIQLGGANS
jgi:hypothetical protein